MTETMLKSRLHWLSAAAALALGAAVHAQSPFGTSEGFEPAGDNDTFVPTNSDPTSVPPFFAPGHPGETPGGQSPPLPLPDFDDSRFNAWDGLIEEVASGFGGVTSHTGAGHAIVYPGTDGSYLAGFRNGPFGRNGRQTAFPGGATATRWAWQVDMFAESVPSPGNPLDYFWWTSAAGNNVDGQYLTESGFQIHPGLAAWTFTTTTGGQPSINLPTGVWYHLEVVFERSVTNPSAIVQVHHHIYNANRTALLYSHTLPAFTNPASSTLGGPRYTWFSVWNDNIVDHIHVDNVGTRAGDASLSLVATDTCLNATDNQLTVEVRMTGATQNVVGGQFFLQYDTTRLSLPGGSPGSVVPGDAPFTSQVYECSPSQSTGSPPPPAVCTPTPGLIDFAVGVNPFNDPGTSADTVLARITFNVINPSQACSVADLVTFRPNNPPTLLSNANGQVVSSTTSNLGAITIDQVAPIITCPPNVVVNADAGLCTASFNSVVGNWVIGGGAQYVAQPNGNVAVQITSANPGPPAFSFAYHNLAAPFLFQNLTDLSADYMMQSGCFNGGAPRFSVRVDFDNNGVISAGDKNVHIYWGTLPSYTDCPPLNTWLNSGDLADATDARYDLTQVGGAFYDTRANANTLVGNMLVLRVNIPMDGQFSPGTQQMLLDNVNINGTLHTFNGATATDNCTASPTITAVRSDAPATLTDPYPVGVTTITYTATDACGNSSQCQQTVTVNNQNTVAAAVELKDVFTPVSRAVTFQFFSGVTLMDTVCAVVSFTDHDANGATPVRGTATFDVDCGLYDCITVRDTLHTLRRTISSGPEFGISGVQYAIESTSDGANDDSLISGNLNDDRFIDILDFGAFAGQFNQNYGTGNTTCATTPPHADFTGDGLVIANDYTFIANNFLVSREVSCDGTADSGGPEAGPVTRISVKELIRNGMHDLVKADFNRDGWLDTLDIQAFFNGGGSSGGAGLINR